MELTKEVQKKLALKLQQSRLRLLEMQPFYGLLLLHLSFSLDVSAETAYTDGDKIAFNPEFLNDLSDSEVDFVLMHEVLHVALSHTLRGAGYEDQDAFNYAADIVVNSNILYSYGMDLNAISLGESETMHNLPDGREGYNFSAEDIYPIIKELKDKKKLVYKDLTSNRKRPKSETGGDTGKPFDSHEKWGSKPSSDNKDNVAGSKEVWLKRMVDATDLIDSMSTNMPKSIMGQGMVPAFMERLIKELKNSQLDWRTILHNFIQEEVKDYSFTPPDRRFQDSEFFLPDYNEKDESVKNILFMIDTSGSMSNDEIRNAFSEVKGALDQFDGKLCGWVGFFDAKVYQPKPFDDVNSLLEIRPQGGGGTAFDIIFKYVRDEMDEKPESIIILTDGYAEIPKEEEAMGIPVLWLIDNENITPDWGMIARIKNE